MKASKAARASRPQDDAHREGGDQLSETRDYVVR
jgi:hypothetical protein